MAVSPTAAKIPVVQPFLEKDNLDHYSELAGHYCLGIVVFTQYLNRGCGF